MPCYHPMLAYRSRTRNENGSWPIVFNPNDGHSDLRVELPCGKCIGCRLEKSRQWAIRCEKELKEHDESCFLTLTYDDKWLPKGSTLHPPDFTNFMKKFRRFLDPLRIRFFQCGEYGELGRPHHHAIIFGYDFKDKELYKDNYGNPLYTSNQLNALWGLGYATIGSVTFESCAYVARYVLKKIYGEKSDEHYAGRKPEYVTMSRQPGIGMKYFQKYSAEIYATDTIITRGYPVHPPKIFDERYRELEPKHFAEIKAKRIARAKKQGIGLEDLARIESVKVKKQERISRK